MKILSGLKVLFTQKAHDKDINSVCVSPNDEYLALDTRVFLRVL
jgi:hypothetical protein